MTGLSHLPPTSVRRMAIESGQVQGQGQKRAHVTIFK